MAQGQTTADLFNPEVVQDIRLSINSRDNQARTRWVKIQFNVVGDTLRDPLQGPLPDKARYWSRVLRFQLSR